MNSHFDSMCPSEPNYFALNRSVAISCCWSPSLDRFCLQGPLELVSVQLQNLFCQSLAIICHLLICLTTTWTSRSSHSSQYGNWITTLVAASESQIRDIHNICMYLIYVWYKSDVSQISVRSGGHGYTCTQLKEDSILIDMRGGSSDLLPPSFSI